MRGRIRDEAAMTTLVLFAVPDDPPFFDAPLAASLTVTTVDHNIQQSEINVTKEEVVNTI